MCPGGIVVCRASLWHFRRTYNGDRGLGISPALIKQLDPGGKQQSSFSDNAILDLLDSSGPLKSTLESWGMGNQRWHHN